MKKDKKKVKLTLGCKALYVIIAAIFVILIMFFVSNYSRFNVYIFGGEYGITGNYIEATGHRMFTVAVDNVYGSKLDGVKVYGFKYTIEVDGKFVFSEGDNLNTLVVTKDSVKKSLLESINAISMELREDLPELNITDESKMTVMAEYIDENKERMSYIMNVSILKYISSNKLLYKKAEM